MVRQRSRNVPKMRVWGLPSTRKVTTQVIPSKKNKLNKRTVRKEEIRKILRELEPATKRQRTRH
ncbi:MAG: hypothetical protein ABH860_01090 [bacterium]